MLTDEMIETAESRAKPYKISDGGSLYVYVTPNGSKSLRWKYRVNRIEKLLTLGRYPTLKIDQARMLVSKAREKLRTGIDPANKHMSLGGWNAAGLDDLDSLPKPLNESRVYFIQAITGHIKIGISTNVPLRFLALQGAHAEPLTLLASFPGSHAHERVLHRAFDSWRDSGEWFSPCQDLMEFIDRLRAAQCR